MTRRCRGSCELQFSLHGRIQGSVWASGRALVLARRSGGLQRVDAEGLWVGGEEKEKKGCLDCDTHGGTSQSEVGAV